MTRRDVGYLLSFLGVLAITVVFVSGGKWLAALFPGVFVLLFVVHMTLNLSSPPSFEQVVSLLKASIDPTDRRSVLNDYDGGDYSSFEAFCDTPNISSRQLNRIRVRCYNLLHDDRFFHRDPVTNQLTITQDGSAAVRSLLGTLGPSAGGKASDEE